jgi:hypothetical protein
MAVDPTLALGLMHFCRYCPKHREDQMVELAKIKEQLTGTKSQQQQRQQQQLQLFGASAALVRDNSKATDIFISGVQGDNSIINGLYAPTQKRGQDGRIVYWKCDIDPGSVNSCFEFYIEHFEGDWQVKLGEEMGGPICLAYTRGEGALEDCCLREWNVFDGGKFTIQPTVKFATVQKAKFKASVRGIFEPECRINTVFTFSFYFCTCVH